MKQGESLKDALKNAKSSQEVNDLMVIGNEYKYANDKTKRQWCRIANKKINQLLY